MQSCEVALPGLSSGTIRRSFSSQHQDNHLSNASLVHFGRQRNVAASFPCNHRRPCSTSQFLEETQSRKSVLLESSQPQFASSFPSKPPGKRHTGFWRSSAVKGPGSDTAPASTPTPSPREASGVRGLDDSAGIVRNASVRVKIRRGRLRSTALDRGETTGAPGSVETRVAKGVEDGTGYDSDVEVGSVKLPHEQPWGGIHPAVQFVTEFLRGELPKFFAEEGFSSPIYRKDVHFRDPLISVRGVQLFEANVFLLRLLFAGGNFVLHDIRPRGKNGVAARWTFVLPTRFLPWQPPIAFTGVSTFGVDMQQAKLTSHYDYWDNLTDKENEPPSLAAIAYVASQIQPLTVFNRPLDRPFLLLRRAKDYDIRRYEVEDEASGAAVIAVRRGKADLIRALNDDRIQVDRTECSVRTVRTSWPHKQLKEVYVSVTYVPEIDDHSPVGNEGVDWDEV